MPVHSIKILLPVAVVGLSVSSFTLNVFRDRRDPDRVKSHTLNVVEFLDDSSPGAAAVDARGRVAGGGGAAISAGEAVGEELVNAAAAPFCWAGGEGAGEEEGNAQCAEEEF